MSNKVYDILKYVAQIAVDAFLGAVLGIASYNYNKE